MMRYLLAITILLSPCMASAIEKNVAGQKITVFAFDKTTNLPKTGLTNIVLNIQKDGGAAAALGDATVTEVSSTLDPGGYVADLTQAESSANDIVISGTSVTADVVVLRSRYTTTPPSFASPKYAEFKNVLPVGSGQLYSDIDAADAVAAAGDLVLIYPGTYTNTGIGLNDVTYYAMPGVVIDLTASSGAHLFTATLARFKFLGHAKINIGASTHGGPIFASTACENVEIEWGSLTGGNLSSADRFSMNVGAVVAPRLYLRGQRTELGGAGIYVNMIGDGEVFLEGDQLHATNVFKLSDADAFVNCNVNRVSATNIIDAASTAGRIAFDGSKMKATTGLTVPSGVTAMCVRGSVADGGLNGAGNIYVASAFAYNTAVSTASALVATTPEKTRSELASATYGLAVTKTAVDGLGTTLANATYGLAAIKTAIDGLTGSYISDSGTAQLGSTTTIRLRSGAPATSGLLVGQTVTITSGPGAGQSRSITAYNGTTKDATVDRAWATGADASTGSIYTVRDYTPDVSALASIAGIATATSGIAGIATNVTTLLTNVATVDTVADSIYALLFGAPTVTVALDAAGLTAPRIAKLDSPILSTSSDAATAFDRSARSIVIGTVNGTGTDNDTIVTSSLNPPAVVANQFTGRVILFDKNTFTPALRGQGTPIISNTSGGVFTVTPLTTPPVSTDTFTIN